MNIVYLPHTADIRMGIQGSHLIELFQAGVLGMGNILKEGICEKKAYDSIKYKIDIKAIDPTCLLIDFLSEILSTSYAEKIVFCKVKFLKLIHERAIAEIQGVKVEEFDEEIKAVTYHEADVHRTDNGHWETIIIFDI